MQKSTHHLAALFASLFVLSVQPSAQRPLPQPFDSDEVPTALLHGGDAIGTGGALARAGHQSGRLTADCLRRKIRIYWQAGAFENVEPNHDELYSNLELLPGTAKATTSTQLFQTSFYPTAIGKLSESEFLVAGMNIAESTMIQKWTFQWPATMPEIETEETTGYTFVDVVLPTVSKTTIYHTFGSPKYVTGICGVLNPSGQPTHALVQFGEPNDVVLLDLASGGTTLVASATNGTATFGTLPSLSHPLRNHRVISVLNHHQRGYIYRFWRSFVYPDTLILQLVDADRDGTIDEVLELTTDEYVDEELDRLSNYEEWWLP